jgi:hypothetical protein
MGAGSAHDPSRGPHGIGHSSSSSMPTSSSTTSRCSTARASRAAHADLPPRSDREQRGPKWATACSARTDTIYAIDNGLMFHAEPKLRHRDLGFRRRAHSTRRGAAIERLLDEGLPRSVSRAAGSRGADRAPRRGKALTRRGRFPKTRAECAIPGRSSSGRRRNRTGSVALRPGHASSSVPRPDPVLRRSPHPDLGWSVTPNRDRTRSRVISITHHLVGGRFPRLMIRLLDFARSRRRSRACRAVPSRR